MSIGEPSQGALSYAPKIAAQIQIGKTQAAAAIDLMESGCTIPFIARYRKEATNSLDEEQLRQVSEWLDKLRSLDERRQTILHSIEEQGKLTVELRAQIQSAASLSVLEDLYQPYKPKRRTRASVAREKGLQGLADLILQQPKDRRTAEEMAAAFLSAEVPTSDEAWAGACDIVAETISDHPEVRQSVRQKALQWGVQRCEKVEAADDPKQVYATYYDFEFKIDRLAPHQVLAINRGEAEKVLKVKVEIAERDWREAVQRVFHPDGRSILAAKLNLAIDDAAGRLLLPAIERDVRRELTEKAEAQAIRVFADNLRSLLNQPPLLGQTVLGLDPGFRTGCKAAVVDPTGKLLDTATIYPHEPQNRWKEALETLALLVVKHHVTLISIGNGTASRETEKLAAGLIQRLEAAKTGGDVRYLIVNEAGASVYSASPLARAELPALDVSLRGAVSIARRAQDPLAELVKIDPKSIGVGMYQHDVDQKRLSAALDGVVESVVNQVGVDGNTASPALLSYVSGIGAKLAERIVAHRDENGIFGSRKALRDVSGLGPKAYEQAAGFLRVRGGDEPLDETAIHPESYPLARSLLKLAGVTPRTPLDERRSELAALVDELSVAVLAKRLEAGVPTLTDILEQLARPGRDPRQDLPAPILRSDVLSMEDLTTGMRLSGVVRNVVDFGAFVDIGVHQDGLLHRSQLPRGQVLHTGDVIDVEVLKVEKERGRIALGWGAPARVKEN